MTNKLSEYMNSLVPWLLNNQVEVKELMISIQIIKERIIFLTGQINDNVASSYSSIIIFRG